jgi:hypothetical protein
MVFFTATTMATDDRIITMANVAINGNSGIVGAGEGDEKDDEGDEVDDDVDVEVVDGEDEPPVASTVPRVTVAVMGSEVPPGA